MKWFKHDCDMHTNLKIQSLMDKHGLKGYAIFNLCLEIIGQQGKKGRLKGDLDWKKALHKISGFNELPELETILSDMAKSNLICSKSFKKGDLYIPKFLKRADDYTSRKIRTLSEQSMENVHVDKKRIDKIRTEYIRLKEFDVEKFTPYDYARTGKAIKTLLINAEGKAERVCEAIEWVSKRGYCDWTLETVIKKWADFMKYADQPELLKKWSK